MRKSLFDLATGELLKAAGMNQAAESRSYILLVAQQAAVKFASENPTGEATIDAAQDGLEKLGYSSEDLGPAAGSVFRGNSWEWTGRYTKSLRVSNHARNVKVWRLRK